MMIRALGAGRKKKAVLALLKRFDFKAASALDAALIARALGASQRQEATDALLEAWAYIDLERLRSPALSAGHQALLLEIPKALGAIADIKAIPALRKGLADFNGRIAESSVSALGRLKDGRSVDWMIRLAESADKDVSRAACEALAEIGGENARAALLKIASSPDHAGRVAAAYGLARLGQRRGSLLLDGYLEEVEKPYPEGVLAAYYLTRLGKMSGLDYLVRVCEDKSSELRSMGIEALGRSKEPRAALPLTELLSEGDTNARLMSVRALGELGGSRALHALKRAWKKDENKGVRGAAHSALADLGKYYPSRD